jgi:hypothetical protein
VSKFADAAERNKQPIPEVLQRGAEVLFLYGPYRRRDRPTAPSNEEFDAWLRTERDPRWGLRAVEAVAEEARASGFRLDELVEMPSNNLSLVLRSD